MCLPLNSVAQTLHLFGGKNHDKYLGCLNCDKYNEKSIWNQYGEFGSKYNEYSIWNSYGIYGGSYGEFSPFNQYSATPPAIVDKEGKFYGYFTINKYNDKQSKLKLAAIIYDYWEQIKDNVGDWYSKVFK